jgi:TonB family protein
MMNPTTSAATIMLAIGVLGADARLTPARLRQPVLPAMPIQAVAGGEVLLDVAVNASGRVASIDPLRTTPPFTDALVSAVRGWIFQPAEERVEGTPPSTRQVASRVLVAAVVRPPTLNTPTLGEPPRDVAQGSPAVPYPVRTIPPLYPPLARDSGTVLLELDVDDRGGVTGTAVVRSSPAFDAAAIDAARRWTFRPARVDGRTVPSLVYVVLVFRQPVTVG